MDTGEKTIWDAGVRTFHWSLVICFITAYLTGEEDSDLHVYAGYAIIGLLAFRILWGFVGTKHARFADFIYSPRRVIAYLQGLLKRDVEHYDGHNPAGGMMIIAMLLCLIATSYTGLKTYGAEGYGPLANDTTRTIGAFIPSAYADSDEDEEDDDDDNEYEQARHQTDRHSNAFTRDHGKREHDDESEDYWEEWHEFFASLMMLLIILHIMGVVVSSRVHGENLVRAMITGKKSSSQY